LTNESDILHRKNKTFFAKPKNKNGIFQITAIRTKKRLWKETNEEKEENKN